MKVMDAGRVEVEAAAKAGADVVMCLGAASDATVQDCIAGGKQHGVGIGIDLVSVADPVARAKEVEAMGADFVSVHTPIDQQMEGADGLETLKAVAAAVSPFLLPVLVALPPRQPARLLRLVHGLSLLAAQSPKPPMPRPPRQNYWPWLGRRCAGRQPVRASPLMVFAMPWLLPARPTSDAMHRGGAVHGLTNMNPGKKLVGPAVTVTAFPGDWSCPVQAIDRCPEGAVLVIDAAGVGPRCGVVWPRKPRWPGSWAAWLFMVPAATSPKFSKANCRCGPSAICRMLVMPVASAPMTCQ